MPKANSFLVPFFVAIALFYRVSLHRASTFVLGHKRVTVHLSVLLQRVFQKYPSSSALVSLSVTLLATYARTHFNLDQFHISADWSVRNYCLSLPETGLYFRTSTAHNLYLSSSMCPSSQFEHLYQTFEALHYSRPPPLCPTFLPACSCPYHLLNNFWFHSSPWTHCSN